MNSKTLSNQEISSFCEQFSLILRSGIPASEGLSLMAEDAGTEGRHILHSMQDILEQTGSLYQAMNDAGVFPSYALHMAEIGERSGTMDEVMEAIGQYYQREEALSQSIKSAVTYPLIMLGMMLAVILVLIIKVLPVFQQVYEELGSSLTGFSKGLLSVGAVLQKYALVFFGGAVFLLALFLFLTKTSKGRDILHKMGSHLPFVRGMYEKISASRFAGAMAITLSSGLDANQSMELAARLSDNKFLEKRIEACQKQMEEGKSFSAALSDTGIFSGLYARMLAIGMKTGTLDDSMKKIAAQYQMEIDDRLARLISSLEPTLVILLSVVVGMILLSVMLPLLGIMSGSGLF